MKRWWLTVLAALPLGAQTFDYKFLDKLAEKAKESSVVNIGPEQMELLKGLSGEKEKGELGDLAKTMKGIHVRSYEFNEPGQYNMDEVRAFRDKIKASGEWVSIVSVKEAVEFTDIMIEKGPDGKSKGFLIVAAEPKELSIVHIDGPLDLAALGKLGGSFGIPAIVGGPKKGATPPAAAKPAKAKSEEGKQEEI